MKAAIKNEKFFIEITEVSVVQLHRNVRGRIFCHAHVFYWQASQPGSSIAQNLMSVAGVALICARAVAAAASIAFMLPLSSVLPEATELSLPALTVDFSACVAPMVRR